MITNKKTQEEAIKNTFDEWFDTMLAENQENTIHDIEMLLSISKANLNDKIVDFGCGDGRHLFELKKRNFKDLFGIDISEVAIKKAQKIAGQDSSIQFNNKSFFDFLDECNDAIDLAVFFDFTITLYQDKYIYELITLLLKKITKNGKIFIESWNYDFLKKSNCMNYERKYKIKQGEFIDKSTCDFNNNYIIFQRKLKKNGFSDF
ncbi:MAG TPA: class I SAM-dependent methyltransferase [Rickettsiales bacterium]|nr:class I SAM-dependent methyltransferase [Rickettsiales bacterium]